MATIDLLSLEPQRISRDLRGKYLFAYGDPGVGKTTLASQFEKTLIMGFEMGTNALDNIYVVPIRTWKDFTDYVKKLCRTDELKEKFVTIAIDTVDEAWKLCVKQVCSNAGVEALGDVGFGKLYDVASKEFQQPFRDLTYSGYALVFTGHSVEKTYKNEKNEEYTKIQPALPTRPFDIINKMVDIIGYIREVTFLDGANSQRKRVIFFRDEVGDRFLTKSRYKYMVPYVDLDYKSFVDAVYTAIDKQSAESGNSTTTESNPYTQLNFDELMEDAKTLWAKASNEDKITEVKQVLNKIFEKDIRFSEIMPDEIDKLHQAILEIRDVLK